MCMKEHKREKVMYIHPTGREGRQLLAGASVSLSGGQLDSLEGPATSSRFFLTLLRLASLLFSCCFFINY